MIGFINSILSYFDARLVRKSSYKKLLSKLPLFYLKNDFSELIDSKHRMTYFENFNDSKAQLGQDLFVLSELDFKKNGFFVEFGATNGIDLSNTFMLEKKFGWNGILAEPAKLWHSELELNRSSSIEFDCVWKTSGDILLFNEVKDDLHKGELSTIDSFTSSDGHALERKSSNKYEVKTISLYDMLKKHNAPRTIDYLSIDTEGSEFEILSSFDFDEYDIKIITCEHNHTSRREKIFEMLSAQGYERKYTEYSLFDDWYVRK
tara:strand:- start:514 stop:1299 length:786 start_codon:yes stop_codon:yes gene_type:complete